MSFVARAASDDYPADGAVLPRYKAFSFGKMHGSCSIWRQSNGKFVAEVFQLELSVTILRQDNERLEGDGFGVAGKSTGKPDN